MNLLKDLKHGLQIKCSVGEEMPSLSATATITTSKLKIKAANTFNLTDAGVVMIPAFIVLFPKLF